MRDVKGAFWERMGLNCYVSGNYAAAEHWLRKLEKREGQTLRVLRGFSLVALARGDAEEAGRCLRLQEKLFGPSLHSSCALGDIAYATGRREEALKRYRAALACPEADGAKDTGEGAVQRKLLEARVAICADAAAYERSRKAAGRFADGEAAREEERYVEAVAAFEEAAALDPSHWPALNNAGTILLTSLGDPARALGLFERAAELSGSPQCLQNAELARKAIVREKNRL